MYIGEQLINPSAERWRLSTQLGVERDVNKLREYRKWVESFDLKIDLFALDVGSILLNFLTDEVGAQCLAEVLQENIQTAADAGLTALKHNVQMVGITRTGLRPGRGGVQYSGFRLSSCNLEADRKHSYWGVGYPTNQDEGDSESKLLCGQKLAKELPPVTEERGWRAIEFLVGQLVPAADQAGIRLACHPHDPAYPVGGLSTPAFCVRTMCPCPIWTRTASASCRLRWVTRAACCRRQATSPRSPRWRSDRFSVNLSFHSNFQQEINHDTLQKTYQHGCSRGSRRLVALGCHGPG